MRPPICEVCEAEVEPAGGLVRCAPTPESVLWRERAEAEGFVGHPPDTGWFCEAHAPAARELAAGHSLPEVIREVRRADGKAADEREATDASSAGPLVVGDITDLTRALRKLLPALAEAAGMGGAAVVTTTERDWSPMDGTVPPNCPFTDATVSLAEAGDVRLALEFEAAHWNEDDCARTYLTLSLTGAGERDYRVAAASPASGAPYEVEFLRVGGAMPDAVTELLARA